MRKRFALLVTALTAAAVLVPAAPAGATTCYIEDPGVDDVQCTVFSNPGVLYLCQKIRVC